MNGCLRFFFVILKDNGSETNVSDQSFCWVLLGVFGNQAGHVVSRFFQVALQILVQSLLDFGIQGEVQLAIHDLPGADIDREQRVDRGAKGAETAALGQVFFRGRHKQVAVFLVGKEIRRAIQCCGNRRTAMDGFVIREEGHRVVPAQGYAAGSGGVDEFVCVRV